MRKLRASAHALKKFTPLPPEFFNNCCREVWHKTVGAAAMESRATKNKHSHTAHFRSQIRWWVWAKHILAAVRKKLICIQQRIVQNTIFDVRSERDLCNRLSFHRTALLCGNEFCFLDAIEIGGAKLIKCHTQWNCDDKWPTHERLRLQIIDAAADIYLFKTPKEKSESSVHIYTWYTTMLQRKSPLLRC